MGKKSVFCRPSEREGKKGKAKIEHDKYDTGRWPRQEKSAQTAFFGGGEKKRVMSFTVPGRDQSLPDEEVDARCKQRKGRKRARDGDAGRVGKPKSLENQRAGRHSTPGWEVEIGKTRL